MRPWQDVRRCAVERQREAANGGEERALDGTAQANRIVGDVRESRPATSEATAGIDRLARSLSGLR